MLLPTSTYSTNQRGQRRQIKRREEQVILAALGVWPDGRYQVICFEMVEKETKASWKRFFRNLLAKGLDASILQLVVSDGTEEGRPSTVTIDSANGAPTANAGPDQAISAGATVQLNAVNSSDPDGDPLSYQWTILERPNGPAARGCHPR